jgi:hypothetical protein
MGEPQQLFQGETMWIALLAALAIVVWYFTRGTGSSGGARAPTAPPVPVAAFAWPELGEYDFEVVGESNYQHALSALADTPDPDEEKTGTAILVPEDSNPHDNKAVRVTVQGLTIGYLSREDARSYRRRLAAKKLGMVPASCGVLVTGGYVLKDGSRAHYGAQLDMKPFDN